MNEEVEVQIVLPAVSDDEVSLGLVRLTETLDLNGFGEKAMGFLGGEFGYGVEYENDVFMMHPFCWCERDDCPWCAGCECPDSAYHYFTDGVEVSYEEWGRFFQREAGGPKSYEGDDFAEWSQRAEAVNKRRPVTHDKVCRVCRGEFGNAPNFLHKPSGSKIIWYKYIGRSMEVELRAPWDQIFRECIDSLTRGPA